MNGASEFALDGGCACGQVRYRITRQPIAVHACHCRYCQRMSGSAYGYNAMVESAHVQLLGAGQPMPVHTASTHPDGQTVLRCPHCLVALWTHHRLLGPDIALVLAGTLDRPEQLPPTVSCYTASRQPWVPLAPGVPAFEDEYDVAAIWGPEGQARVAAAMRG
ncbi:GFA family protein [Bordetella petrii]|uniref:GFA family protein n=1 Tax=Bordetella petrii TaxID=94624 RepID=UPI001E6325FD|nr:GFA family protein [Bordetella petrii]MCD0504163.1 GFA family protein [Bordetella petrii]